MACLDKFLVTGNWDLSFGGVRQCLFPRPTSDHFLVMLEGGARSIRGPSPFRFENMWLKAEGGFKNLINGWWHNIDVRGIGNYVLMEKLKGNLRIWNIEVFGKVEERKYSYRESGLFGCC